MKFKFHFKYLFLPALFMLVMHSVQAQTSGAIVTTQPATFTGEDQVKIIIDVSNVPNLAGVEPLYIWTWNPNDPSPGNGEWTNSSEGRRLVKEGPNRWSITMVPKDFYGVEAASITQIQFLVKAKDGSNGKQTSDLSVKVAPLTFVPTDFRTFPRIVSVNDVVTFYLDQSLAPELNTQRMTPASARISLLTEGNTVIGTPRTVTLRKEGERLYSYTLMPSHFFGLPFTNNAAKMRVVFIGKILNQSGVAVDVESAEYIKVFDNLK
jgi:hypothetical protein